MQHVSLLTSLLLFSVNNVNASETKLNDDPSATTLSNPTYSKSGMAAYQFMMDDALLGNTYEKPIWNLHDALNLPNWLSLGVDQRTPL